MDHLLWLIGIGAGILLGATLLKFLPGSVASRLRLRRTVLIFIPYAVLALLAVFENPEVAGRWLDVVQIAADFSAVLLGINLAALTLFDILARIVRLKVPDILHDLTVGAAYAVALVWLMHRSGVNLASIVATSAVVTAVIGLSLQSTLGSVIGGLALQVDDSVKEGDWIELDTKVQGQIKKVRWRHTVIETRDWDTLIVPNNQLLNQTLKILGKREGKPLQHRMWVYFHVDFRTPPSEVIRAVDHALATAPLAGVAKEPKPNTICLDLARDGRESFALYAVRYWLTDIERDDPTSSAVRERVYSALKRAQIPLAIPAAALFVANDDSERVERKREERQERMLADLCSVELFRGLSEQELDQLAASIRVAPFVAGEVVTRQGDAANWLYVLTKGRVEIRVATGDDSTKRVNVLSAPDYFGEMAVMTGAVREATVVAIDDIECLRIDRRAFRKLLERRPEIAQEVAQVLAERRVALGAAREHLDAEARSRRMAGEQHRILSAVQEFFGLKG